MFILIDYRDLPVADVPHAHGLSFHEAIKILKIFVCNSKFAGLVIAEFNAYRDVDGTLCQPFIKAISEALRDGHESWK
ncbi:MAG: hypothetical protein ACP5JH_10460 [Bacteroidota bacterium]